jgi:DNA sulfur modification protein DndC
MFDEIIDKMEAAIAALIGLIRAGHPLCGTVSGKDSTCATILMLEAVRRIGQSGESQPAHYISTADTTIENSSLARHTNGVKARARLFVIPAAHSPCPR